MACGLHAQTGWARCHHTRVVAAVMATVVLTNFCGMGMAQTTTGDCSPGRIFLNSQMSQRARFQTSCMLTISPLAHPPRMLGTNRHGKVEPGHAFDNMHSILFGNQLLTLPLSDHESSHRRVFHLVTLSVGSTDEKLLMRQDNYIHPHEDLHAS